MTLARPALVVRSSTLALAAGLVALVTTGCLVDPNEPQPITGDHKPYKPRPGTRRGRCGRRAGQQRRRRRHRIGRAPRCDRGGRVRGRERDQQRRRNGIPEPRRRARQRRRSGWPRRNRRRVAGRGGTKGTAGVSGSQGGPAGAPGTAGTGGRGGGAGSAPRPPATPPTTAARARAAPTPFACPHLRRRPAVASTASVGPARAAATAPASRRAWTTPRAALVTSASAGYCRPDPDGGGRCIRAADCSGGTCINGYCHGGCAADADCGPRDRCDSGICRVDNRPRPPCRANVECSAGQMCVNGICRSGCTTDVDCCDCAASVCRAGYCVTAGEAAPVCALGNDCRSGQSCIDAVCQQRRLDRSMPASASEGSVDRTGSPRPALADDGLSGRASRRRGERAVESPDRREAPPPRRLFGAGELHREQASRCLVSPEALYQPGRLCRRHDVPGWGVLAPGDHPQRGALPRDARLRERPLL